MKNLTLLIALISLCAQVPTMCMNQGSASSNPQKKRERPEYDDQNDNPTKYPKYVDNDKNSVRSDKLTNNELHSAAFAGDVEKTKTLLRRNSKLAFEKNSKQQTPLHLICFTKKLRSQESADLIDYCCNQFTNNKEALKKLLNAQDDQGETPFHVAAAAGNYEAVKVLLKNGADTTIKFYEKHKQSKTLTLLHRAIMTKNSRNTDLILRELLKDKDCLNMIDNQLENGDTPLMRAISLGKLECVKILLDHGANRTIKTNEKNSFSRTQTVLHSALLTKYSKYAHLILEELLKYDNCKQMINDRLAATDMTPLDLALTHNDYECVYILLKNGAHILYNTSTTALSLKTDYRIITLLQQSIQKNQYQDSQGNTPKEDLTTLSNSSIAKKTEKEELEIEIPDTHELTDEEDDNPDSNLTIEELDNIVIEDKSCEEESSEEKNNNEDSNDDNDQWIIIEDLKCKKGSQSPIIEEEEEESSENEEVSDETAHLTLLTKTIGGLNQNIASNPVVTKSQLKNIDNQTENTTLTELEKLVKKLASPKNQRTTKILNLNEIQNGYCAICKKNFCDKHIKNLN